ncbi:hypothetical protein HHI36_018443 [Cryptolaemus montrouzieri]|uniref:PHD-type domain-containing protein n=1 Tax=Cryptolaemus montrouzieri TaxID=559131 RepID=A0ABD2P178_9CUCU
MSDKCPGCKMPLGKKGFKIRCSGPCSCWFHQKCAEISESDRKLIESKKFKWTCNGCGGPSDREEDPEDEDNSPKLRDVMDKLISIENSNRALLKQLKLQEAKCTKLEKDLIDIRKKHESLKKEIASPYRDKGKADQELLRNNIIINNLPKGVDVLKEAVVKIGNIL